MRDWVSEWVQEGRLYIWRYADPNRSWRGWHLTGDPAGCRSIRSLLDRMHGGQACYRTLRLEPTTDSILRVPNYGKKCLGQFVKLKLDFQPDADALQIEVDGAALTMTVGNKRLRYIAAAFVDVEVGNGDFGIATSNNRKADNWMFWWMLDVNYGNLKLEAKK